MDNLSVKPTATQLFGNKAALTTRSTATLGARWNPDEYYVPTRANPEMNNMLFIQGNGSSFLTLDKRPSLKGDDDVYRPP